MKISKIDLRNFNANRQYPYDLRIEYFQLAMQDVYDFFYDVGNNLVSRSIEPLEDMLRPAAMSGIISDMLTVSLAKHSRTLVPNNYHNGHPDLIINGSYPGNSVKAALEGIEVKTTRKTGGAVDTHGAREQWMCVFVYLCNRDSLRPAREREPVRFTEVYLSRVSVADFRKNSRSELGTRTATLHKDGLARFRKNWVYLEQR